AVIEIGLLLRMTGRPARITSAAPVPGVRRPAGVAAIHGFSQPEVADGARVAAVADAEEPPVPASRRKPYFNSNLRIARRTHRCFHSAKRRQAIEGSEELDR